MKSRAHGRGTGEMEVNHMEGRAHAKGQVDWEAYAKGVERKRAEEGGSRWKGQQMGKGADRMESRWRGGRWNREQM
jgi:hypothetical protein